MSPARLVALSSLAACLTALVAVSCGTKQTCINCNGCCDDTAICQPGITVAICGAAGDTCKKCGSADTCDNGTCTPPSSSGGNQSGTGGGTSSTGGGTASTGGGHAAGGGSAAGGSTGAGGGAHAVCSSDNCNGGCCDIFGACQTSTGEHCGTKGIECQACIATQVCQFGDCTGGGTGGGQEGTGGGSVSGCGTLALNGGTTTGVVEDGDVSVAITHLGNATLSEVTYELWWINQPMPPVTETFDTSTTWGSCDGCITYRQGCTGTSTQYPYATCTGDTYFAQAGSITVTSADSSSPGSIIGSSHGIVLRKWDFGADQAVPDGGCLLLPDSAFNVTF